MLEKHLVFPLTQLSSLNQVSVRRGGHFKVAEVTSGCETVRSWRALRQAQDRLCRATADVWMWWGRVL